MSEYCSQNLNPSSFKVDSSWVVLSPIEKQIKGKIEKVGKPLKDWDINIYRGILTGYNEAFIIDGKTKDALIAKSAKTAEIIRPILRGRDIKRYKADFADLWIIATFPSRNYNIDDYPAVKEHLLSFGYDRLKQTGEPGARKSTNNQWFETQDSISYWDDFSKQKIVWLTITDKAKFIIDNEGALCLNSTYIMTGEYLYSILLCLNSKLIDWYFDGICVSTGEGTNKWEKFVVEKIPIPETSDAQEEIYSKLIKQLCALTADDQRYGNLLYEIYKVVYGLYNLTEEEIAFIDSL